jgi:hypothetical protein
MRERPWRAAGARPDSALWLQFADVTHVLVDPSCSGSGLVAQYDDGTLFRPPARPLGRSTSVTAAERSRRGLGGSFGHARSRARRHSAGKGSSACAAGTNPLDGEEADQVRRATHVMQSM